MSGIDTMNDQLKIEFNDPKKRVVIIVKMLISIKVFLIRPS